MALIILVEAILTVGVFYCDWHLDNLRGAWLDAIYVKILVSFEVFGRIVTLLHQVVVCSDFTLFEDELASLILAVVLLPLYLVLDVADHD